MKKSNGDDIEMMKERLKGKGRYLLVAILAGVFASSLSVEANNTNTTTIDNEQVVTIKQGDTIWGLADKWKEEDEQILARMDYIIKKNKLEGKDMNKLKIGEKIIVGVVKR